MIIFKEANEDNFGNVIELLNIPLSIKFKDISNKHYIVDALVVPNFVSYVGGMLMKNMNTSEQNPYTAVGTISMKTIRS